METKRMCFRLLLLLVWCLSSCAKEPDIDDMTMLDGDQIFDASIYDPASYLVSAAIDVPSDTQKNTPVIIAVHGYTATTFEWDEFRTYAEANANILVSQVLLGGHGRTYEEFRNSTWRDWQEPIMTEFNALRDKGYTNINFAGSSTACTLLMDLIKTAEIGDNGMKNIFLIDPIVVPSDKLLTLIGLVGPMLGYLESINTAGEEGHWYRFRPQETLQQLMKVIDKVRKDLQNGYRLPAGTRMKVYKSIKDPSADPVSAVLIYKGLQNHDGSAIEVEMIDSELHVMTRLAGRESITQRDRDIQVSVFDNMLMLLDE